MQSGSVVDRVLCRRRVVGFGLLAGVFLPSAARAALRAGGAPRSLDLHHAHTGERLSVTYWADGRYEPQALAEINRILRDFRTGDEMPVDLGLIDLLHDLRRRLDSEAAFEIISGYRSPATNAMLASKSSGVAKRSYHMSGMAVDVRLSGLDLDRLRAAALALGRGGVGHYPSPGFVHLDVGPPRAW